jgi:hypothetical protein
MRRLLVEIQVRHVRLVVGKHFGQAEEHAWLVPNRDQYCVRGHEG